MAFQAQKRSDTKSNVIHHRTQSAALCSLNQTLLFQRPMIHFNPPCGTSKIFSFSFGHQLETCRPIFRRAVCGEDTKYFDFSKSFEPTQRAVAAAQSGFRNSLKFPARDSDLPVRFQTNQKMPREGANRFQVLDRSIPTVETNKLRIKTAIEGFTAFPRNGRSWFCGRGLYQTRDNLPERIERHQSTTK